MAPPGRSERSEPALRSGGHEPVDGRAAGPAGCDVAVDFTRPDAVEANVAACLAERVPVVIGTSGFDTDAVDAAARDAGVPCFHAPNFALGVGADAAVRGRRGEGLPARRDRRVARRRRSTTPRRARPCEHRLLARTGTGDPEIHTLRLPGLVAHQEVVFGGDRRDADDPPRHPRARRSRPGCSGHSSECATSRRA